MADEIIIDVQVNTDEVSQKLSAAIKDLGSLREEQRKLTAEIKKNGDATGEQGKKYAENEEKIKANQASIKSLTAALQVSTKATADNKWQINTQNMTLDEQRQLLGQLQKAYGGLTPEQKKKPPRVFPGRCSKSRIHFTISAQDSWRNRENSSSGQSAETVMG